MDITWHGHACFSVKGKHATVVTDPFGGVGLKEPKPAADVVLQSHGHDDHNNLKIVKGDPYVIDLPGEYESRGVMVEGVPTYHDTTEGADRGRNIVFAFSLDGMHVVHCGDLGHILSDEAVEQIGDVDILMIPVGGHYTIDAKGAVEVVKQLQPRVTIPMHYDVPGLKLPKKLATVDDFLKEAGAKTVTLDKHTWRVKPADLPTEDSVITVFPNP